MRARTPATDVTITDPLVTYEPSPVTAAELNAVAFSSVLMCAGESVGLS
ncbi:hypothetical protein ACQPXT_40305 [Streptomyces sp. CA-100214]